MRRLTIPLTLGLLIMLIMVAPAGAASRVWCAKDPIVSVDGQIVQIWVAVPEEYAEFVNDKIKVKIKTPKGVERQVLFLDEGFNGHGEEVTWGDLKVKDLAEGEIPMEVEIKVKFDKKKIEKVRGKDHLKQEFGTDKIPVQVTVNIGELTKDYETQIHYGVHKKTKFALTVFAESDVAD